MASHKNQHFVPRCYLKPFTFGGEGLAINLFNIDRRQAYRNAPVKGQCARSYFYGEDLKLERLLQMEEGLYANILNAICAPNYCLTDDARGALRRFSLLQHLRTEAVARRALEHMSEFADVASKGDVPADWHTSMREAVTIAMYTFAKSMNVIDDLKVCLIRNKTSRSFITSDNPAIATNRWYLENAKAKGLSGGLGSAGALLFLPLTPQIMCVIYDGDVYTMPNDRGWIVTKRISDIDAFNQHQFLECFANVFFSEGMQEQEIVTTFWDAMPCRPTKRHELITAVLDSDDNHGKRYRVVPRAESEAAYEMLCHVKSIKPKPSRWPSVIRWREKPKIYSNGSGTGFVRWSRADPAFGYKKLS